MIGYGVSFSPFIGDTGRQSGSQPRSGRQEVSFASDAMIVGRELEFPSNEAI